MKICRRKKIRVLISRTTKVLRPFFICLFLLLFCAQHSGAEGKKESTARPRTPPAISQAMIENIKSALTANPWTVYVIYNQIKNNKIESIVEIDVLTFTQDTAASKILSAQGYGDSNYKVKVGADGAYIWEAIQLHENQKDTVLLKGELKNGVMKGVIVYQPQGKPGRTNNFTTVQPK